ncbi:hypothetical protein PTMSG1_03014 [Pyrenophora teres f. maculata]|nr:hypothetical protein PTMSG1_03014 [Pyrenophora teres f. maculata]
MSTPSRGAKPFPVPNATPSYWRKDVGAIDNHRSTETLPATSDVVIIGAGYVGASVAHHLVEESGSRGGAVPSILTLEAREACSGATGRNGGHLKPDPISRAASVLKTHGRAIAEHVASFEARQVAAIRELVERDRIDCDFEETRVTDVCLYKAGRDKMKADIDSIVAADISTARGIKFSIDAEAEERSGVRGALSCHTYHAARLWPYRLVVHLLKKAISNGVNLQTHTPVTSVSQQSTSSADSYWIVDTPRGSIRAKTVVYATNGYTSALVPEMKDKIVPVRGVVARLVGGKAPKMTDSYMMRISDYEYDYMIPRPDGSIILGGAKRDFYKNLHEWFDVADDSQLTKDAQRYFDGYMQRHFYGWEDSGARTQEIWTGIMGYSNDGFPYVGPVCDRPGQYLCAGFNGHGMPQIFLSAKAIATMIVKGNAEDIDLPVPYRISPDRWYEPKEHASLKSWQAYTEGETARAKL